MEFLSDSLMMLKVAHSQCKIAFDFWKQDQFSVNSIVHDDYQSKHKDYHLALPNFLNHIELDRGKKLCVAAETDEKLEALERPKILFPDEHIPCQ